MLDNAYWRVRQATLRFIVAVSKHGRRINLPPTSRTQFHTDDARANLSIGDGLQKIVEMLEDEHSDVMHTAIESIVTFLNYSERSYINVTIRD
jgi:ADP-dependent phosphofructokinase/glucokinase